MLITRIWQLFVPHSMPQLLLCSQAGPKLFNNCAGLQLGNGKKQAFVVVWFANTSAFAGPVQ